MAQVVDALCANCFSIVPLASQTKVICTQCYQSYCNELCASRDALHAHATSSLIGPAITSTAPKTVSQKASSLNYSKVKKSDAKFKKALREQEKKKRQEQQALKRKELVPMADEDTASEDDEKKDEDVYDEAADMKDVESNEEEDEEEVEPMSTSTTPATSATSTTNSMPYEDYANSEFQHMKKCVNEYISDVNELFMDMAAKSPDLTYHQNEMLQYPKELRATPEQLEVLQERANTLFGPTGKPIFIDSAAVDRDIDASVKHFDKFFANNNFDAYKQGENALLRVQARLTGMDPELIATEEFQETLYDPERIALTMVAHKMSEFKESCSMRNIVASYWNPTKKQIINQFWYDITGQKLSTPDSFPTKTAFVGGNGDNPATPGTQPLGKSRWNQFKDALHRGCVWLGYASETEIQQVQDTAAKTRGVATRARTRQMTTENPEEVLDKQRAELEEQQKKDAAATAPKTPRGRARSRAGSKSRPPEQDAAPAANNSNGLKKLVTNYWPMLEKSYLWMAKKQLLERKPSKEEEMAQGGPKIKLAASKDIDENLMLYDLFKAEEDGIVDRLADAFGTLSLDREKYSQMKEKWGRVINPGPSKVQMFEHTLAFHLYQFIIPSMATILGIGALCIGPSLGNLLLAPANHAALMEKHRKAMEDAETEMQQSKVADKYKVDVANALQEDETCPVVPTVQMMAVGDGMEKNLLHMNRIESNLLMKKIILSARDLARANRKDEARVGEKFGEMLWEISTQLDTFPDSVIMRAKKEGVNSPLGLVFTQAEREDIYRHRSGLLDGIESRYNVEFETATKATLGDLVSEHNTSTLASTRQKANNLKIKYGIIPKDPSERRRAKMAAAERIKSVIDELRTNGMGPGNNLRDISNELAAEMDRFDQRQLEHIRNLHELLANALPNKLGSELARHELEQFALSNGFSEEEKEVLLGTSCTTLVSMFQTLVDAQTLDLATNAKADAMKVLRETLSAQHENRAAFAGGLDVIKMMNKNKKRAAQTIKGLGTMLTVNIMTGALSFALGTVATGGFVLLAGGGALALAAGGAAYARCQQAALMNSRFSDLDAIGLNMGLVGNEARDLRKVREKFAQGGVSADELEKYETKLLNTMAMERSQKHLQLAEAVLTTGAILSNVPNLPSTIQFSSWALGSAALGGVAAGLAGTYAFAKPNTTWHDYVANATKGGALAVGFYSGLISQMVTNLGTTHVRIPTALGHTVLQHATYGIHVAASAAGWTTPANSPFLTERALTDHSQNYVALSVGYVTLYGLSKLGSVLLRCGYYLFSGNGWKSLGLALAPNEVEFEKWNNLADKDQQTLFRLMGLRSYQDIKEDIQTQYSKGWAYGAAALLRIPLSLASDAVSTVNGTILAHPRMLSNYTSRLAQIGINANDKKFMNAVVGELEVIHGDLFPNPEKLWGWSLFGRLWGSSNAEKTPTSIFNYYKGPMDEYLKKLQTAQQQIMDNYNEEMKSQHFFNVDTLAHKIYTMTNTVSISEKDTVFSSLCNGMKSSFMKSINQNSMYHNMTSTEKDALARQFVLGTQIFVNDQHMCEQAYSASSNTSDDA